MRKNPREIDNSEIQAPEALVEDLRSLHGKGPEVPPEVDVAVMRMARARLERRGRPAPAVRWALAGAVAGCMLLVSLLLSVPGRLAMDAARGPVAVAREDLDGNGRVDILDAFALARHLETRRPPKTEWDINGDGQVDGADVDLVAMAAVSLERRSLQ